jgi:tetratricopeptide (TPR) repeat protein
MRHLQLTFIISLFFSLPLVAQPYSYFDETTASDLLTQAQTNFEQERYDSAWAYYSILSGDTRYNDSLMVNLALCAYKCDSFGSALKYADSCLANNEYDKHALYIKGLSLEKLGKVKEAKAVLEKVRTIDRNYDHLDKKITLAGVAIFLAHNWYYLLTIFVMIIVLIVLVMKRKNQAA